ncbi:LysE family translocator [Geobacter sp. SVR]|uniref:LysE family translocator n=1 Tax=Geobacter sp. SVR TaxID=2495594 RepID=UPI00143EFF0A|nr:LysE family translocator [Geobacter sp. SVR]BCS54422.1 threonine transporter RhtB [Geobacter sp. SVR]GCF87653.1 threonine transporter RhtB [Geobacter sp. SVR]
MTDFSYWFVFLSTVIILNLSPGPDMIYIMSRTVAHGRNAGFGAALGVCTGALFHVSIAALGLAAILVASPVAFTVAKYVGAAYLIYLGIQAFRSTEGLLRMDDDGIASMTFSQAFRQGVLVDILNPKVSLFFMAFLPQFVRPELGHVHMQTFGLGVLVILLSIPIESSLVLVADKISRVLRTNASYSLLLNRLLGAIFVGLGLNLVYFHF